MTAQTDDELWSAIAEPSRRQVLDLLVSNGEASKLTAQLVILYDGANISAQLDHNPAAAVAARDAAAGLLRAAA